MIRLLSLLRGELLLTEDMARAFRELAADLDRSLATRKRNRRPGYVRGYWRGRG